MESKEYLIYKGPVDESTDKHYYVPIVTNSKDDLVGYLDAVSVVKLMEPDNTYLVSQMLSSLDSERFNNNSFLDLNIDDVTDEHMIEMASEYFNNKFTMINDKKHDTEMFLSYYLSIECHKCGSFYKWNSHTEIPDTSCKCTVCDRTLIDYTGHSDDEFIVIGDQNKKELYSHIVEDIKAQLLGLDYLDNLDQDYK